MPINPRQPNYSLNEGLDAMNSAAQGIRAGDELKLRQAQQLADFLTKGVKPDASGLTDLGQSNQNLQMAQNQFNQAGMQPDSPRSAGLAQFIGKAASGMGAPTGIAASDLEKVQPVIDSSIKAVNAKQVFGSKQGNVNNKAVADAQSRMNHDTSKYNDAIDSASELKDKISLARSGDRVASNMLPVIIARTAVHGGRINVPEIEAAGGSKAFDAKMSRYSDLAAKGLLRPEDYDDMSKFADSMNATASKGKQGIVDRAVRQHGKAYNKDYNTSYQDLTGQGAPQNNGAPPSPQDYNAVTSGFNPDSYLKSTK